MDFDPAKLKAIKEMPWPKNADELRTFIGHASYLCRFIPAMVEITQSFNSLLKKDEKFECRDEHDGA